MMSLRKPKNRNMLLQTLKCMVAIKKKLKEKRSSTSESSDSEDSETDSNTPQNCPNDEPCDSVISELDDERAALLMQVQNNVEESIVEIQQNNDDNELKNE